MLDPPPVAPELALLECVTVYTLELVTVVISNSAFISKPPTAAALVKVTKSPTVAPCPASVTVTIGEPLVVTNGFVRLACVARIGVISAIAPSTYKYNFLSVPKAKCRVPSSEDQAN